jgi:hypothetical protein
MRTYTLRNDFHNTECRVRCEGLSHIYGEATIRLSDAQIRRARRALCGIADCKCATHACGIRGPQTTDDGKRLVVEF